MASRRASWRTPAKNVGPRDNGHFLDGVRHKTYFGAPFEEGSARRQCKGTARSTGKRCNCPAMQGSDYCHKHGGKRNLENRIQKIGGPLVRKNSVPMGMTRRSLECQIVSELEHIVPQLPKSVQRELTTMCRSARGRKLAEVVGELEARGALSD